MFPRVVLLDPVPEECQWAIGAMAKWSGVKIHRMRIWVGDIAGRQDDTALKELWMVIRRMWPTDAGCWYTDHPAKARTRSNVWQTFTGNLEMKLTPKCGDRACVSPLCAEVGEDST